MLKSLKETSSNRHVMKYSEVAAYNSLKIAMKIIHNFLILDKLIDFFAVWNCTGCLQLGTVLYSCPRVRCVQIQIQIKA